MRAMRSIFLVFCIAFAVSCSATKESDEEAADELIIELHEAIYHGNVSEVQSLIDKGVQLNSEKLYPLHESIGLYLIGRFNEEILKLLVKSGAYLEAETDGRTPLLKAIDYDNAKAVKILLENGANPNACSVGQFNLTALQTAFAHNPFIQSGEEIVDALIEYGANINQTDPDGHTLLHKAIIKGYKKAIEMLIERGANVSAVENTWKMTPLHYLASYASTQRSHGHWTDDDYLKIAELLINHGADVFAKSQYLGKDRSPFDLTTSPKLKELLQNKMTTEWAKTFKLRLRFV